MWNKYRNLIAKKAPTPTAVLKEIKKNNQKIKLQKEKNPLAFFLATVLFFWFPFYYMTYSFLKWETWAEWISGCASPAHLVQRSSSTSGIICSHSAVRHDEKLKRRNEDCKDRGGRKKEKTHHPQFLFMPAHCSFPDIQFSSHSHWVCYRAIWAPTLRSGLQTSKHTQSVQNGYFPAPYTRSVAQAATRKLTNAFRVGSEQHRQTKVEVLGHGRLRCLLRPPQ